MDFDEELKRIQYSKTLHRVLEKMRLGAKLPKLNLSQEEIERLHLILQKVIQTRRLRREGKK